MLKCYQNPPAIVGPVIHIQIQEEESGWNVIALVKIKGEEVIEYGWVTPAGVSDKGGKTYYTRVHPIDWAGGTRKSDQKKRTERTARAKVTTRQDSGGGRYLSGGSTDERLDVKKSDEERNSSTERSAITKRSAKSLLTTELGETRKASRILKKKK